MKERKYLLNILLAAALGVALLVCTLLRTFAPAVILPRMDIPAVVLLTLLALLVEFYFAPGAKRNYLVVLLLSVITFGLLPYAAGFMTLLQAGKTALIGGVTATVTALLYTSILQRVTTGRKAPAAPIISAFGLYLAAQCLSAVLA